MKGKKGRKKKRETRSGTIREDVMSPQGIYTLVPVYAVPRLAKYLHMFGWELVPQKPNSMVVLKMKHPFSETAFSLSYAHHRLIGTGYPFVIVWGRKQALMIRDYLEGRNWYNPPKKKTDAEEQASGEA